MALVIEDGTGLATANSFVDEAYVTAYLTDRGREAENGWDTITTAEKEAAMVKATDYIESRFEGRWVGTRLGATQALSWPRQDAYNSYGFLLASDELPVALQKATSEYAIRAVTADLRPDPVVNVSGGSVVMAKTKVGPIEETTQYSEGSYGAGVTKPYPAADKLVTSLLIPAGGVYR